ncbi:hypothetical protein OIU85_016794 [Salix viminalis]|uniref:Uncharacterized protein n=1 Tax=Salix viminalis TaxID=40686 RepID=A0A9Q0V5Y0_SALVM|nr:hypothetical protein OIU85_016794 [Salix viminalis]
MLLSDCGLSRHVIHFLQPFWQTLLNPQDLNFAGYTYKNFDAVKGLHHSFDVKRSSLPRQTSTDSCHSDSAEMPVTTKSCPIP